MNKKDLTYFKIDCNDYTKIQARLNGKLIASLNYKIKNGEVWIYIIKVQKEYRKLGIGKELLNIFENDCYNKRAFTIMGKFYPEDETLVNVKNFYTNNGYSIYKEGYETYVGKYMTNKPEPLNINVIEDNEYTY